MKVGVQALQNEDSDGDDGSSGFRLTFLSIFIIISAIIVLVWVVYYIVRHSRIKNGKDLPVSPIELWFIALTKYPSIFLFFSLIIPIILSSIVFARSGNQVKINLDFDSYLQIDTDLENIRRSYEDAQQNQLDSLGTGFSRKLLEENGFDIQIDWEEDPSPNAYSSHQQRELGAESNLNYHSGGQWISIMYQNRNGGNVFEPDVLRAIHAFESSIYDFPGFDDYCYAIAGKCVQIDSLIPSFFQNGEVVKDIDAVLRSFLTNQPALWKMDQYFGPDNLKSNVVRSFVFFRKMSREVDQKAVFLFLESFYRDFLWKNDQKKGPYSAMVHTWNNGYLKGLEANDALTHDALWSIGSLCFVALIVFLKVQSAFVVFFAMLGMLLSFSVSYYWVSTHFSIQNITLLWVAGLFVMLGIGADDIFLMVDSFDHTKNEFLDDTHDSITDIDVISHDDDDDDDDDDDIDIIEHQETKNVLRKRMESAYSRAGSMMLVSSVTTAICFFSNAFGVLTVVQEFGIFMGMVVLVNYVHVMTILPSSILVNEIYVVPFQQKYFGWLCKQTRTDKANNHTYSKENDMENGSQDSSRNVLEENMNVLDRYLVGTHIPFINKRSSYLLVFSIILALILLALGAAKFSMNDGTIVLFSNKYNLGRVETITNLYFNEDIDKTVEKEQSEATTDESSNTDDRLTDDSVLDFIIRNTTNTTSNDIDTSNRTIINATFTIDFTDLKEELNDLMAGDANDDYGIGSNSSTGGLGGVSMGAGTTSSLGGADVSSVALSGAGVSISGSTDVGVGSTSSTGGVGGISMGAGTTSSTGGTDGDGVSTSNGSLGVSVELNQITAAPLIPVSSVAFESNSGTELIRRETIHVNLIWGVESYDDDSNLWTISKDPIMRSSFDDKNEEGFSSNFDLSEPRTQEWLLEVVEMSRNDPELHIREDKLTWIEILRDFAIEAGVGFPIPKHLFYGSLNLLKNKNYSFGKLIESQIGTSSVGLTGEFTFASVTLMVDALQIDPTLLSETVYHQWTSFAEKVNGLKPSDISPVYVQSRIFLDAYRVEATINSTVTTWFVANGLCLLVILLFIQNIALSIMVMGTILLILFCLGGLLFAVFRIPFGPVEALGVSIFIGLSANYSLHVVHAYHYSKKSDRNDKIKEAIFAVGSPIVASALSTIGACAFLFGCRTWVFIELGVLICSVTAMALLYSMVFLFSWLNVAGPLPFDQYDNNHSLHRWDLKVLCWIPCQKALAKPQIDKSSVNSNIGTTHEKLRQRSADSLSLWPHISDEEAKDDESEYSIEVVQEDDDEEMK